MEQAVTEVVSNSYQDEIYVSIVFTLLWTDKCKSCLNWVYLVCIVQLSTNSNQSHQIKNNIYQKLTIKSRDQNLIDRTQ